MRYTESIRITDGFIVRYTRYMRCTDGYIVSKDTDGYQLPPSGYSICMEQSLTLYRQKINLLDIDIGEKKHRTVHKASQSIEANLCILILNQTFLIKHYKLVGLDNAFNHLFPYPILHIDCLSVSLKRFGITFLSILYLLT